MINKQAAFDKQLLAWEREREVLHRRLSNPPVHLLAEPIQRGWKRHFVLTAEAAHRPDASLLAAILAEINSVFYYWRRDFQPSRRALGLSRRTFSNEQPLRALNPEFWNRQEYPAAWRNYFRVELVPSCLVNGAPGRNSAPARALHRKESWMRPYLWCRDMKQMFAQVFRFPRLFALRVEKNWLTHVSEIEPEVVERVAELDAYINRHNGNHRLGWLRDSSYRYWRNPDDRQRVLRRLAVKEMRAYLGVPVQRGASSSGVADAMPSPYFVWWRHGVGGVRAQTQFCGSEAGVTS